tara:strand:+ start:8936 stop:11833 length:2898 start_codon:yes stop_codon:yes gene_type:complete
MSTLLSFRLHAVALTGTLLLLSGYSQAQNADALSLAVDLKGTVYRLNYQCDIVEDCDETVERIVPLRVKQANAIAIGRAEATNYAFVGSSGNRSRITLLVEEQGGANWSSQTFSGDGASAMVVTRNDDTLYVARPGSAVIERFIRSGAASDPYVGYALQSSDLPPLSVNGSSCQDIVTLEEYPSGSGNLLAVCANPGAAYRITDPASVTPGMSVVPGSVIAGLKSGAVTTVPAGSEQRNYLLGVAGAKEILAIDLDNGSVQRNLMNGSGNVSSIATALCNFFAPSNDVDSDLDVDGPCGVLTQSGSTGRVTLFEIDYDAGTDSLFTTVRETVDHTLRNPLGIDFVNNGTFLAADCLSATGCQIANNRVTMKLAGIDPDTIGAFETQGPFQDPRYDANTGTCAAVDLPLDFTNIPVLENATVGPEFCARNGVFFVDIVSAPEITPTSGYTQYQTPGECWVPGFDPVGSAAPGTSLDDVEYGLLFGDQYDLFRTDGSNNPVAQSSDYVDNLYVQDNLVGCGSRVRAGGRLTFVIEDFMGNELQSQLGSSDDPIADNVLYQYGDREANERINLPLNAVQSGCNEELQNTGHLSGACEDHLVALNAGLAGWDLQRQVGALQTISATDIPDGAAAVSAGLFASDLTLNLSASGGDFSHRQAGGFTVVGISGATDGEINIGESLTATVASVVRPQDLILAGSGGAATAVSTNVPFVAQEMTLALLYDGPEFSDVQEVAQITAVLADDVLTATLTNTAEANGAGDTYTWSVSSLNDRDVSDLQDLSYTVLSGDDSNDVTSNAAIIRLQQPFGNRAVQSIELTAVTGDPSAGCPTCSDQSDFAILDLTFAAVDRVAALAFAYRNYLQALCPVSTRAEYGSGSVDGTRPKLCANTVANTAAFNDVNAAVASRNLAGHQQADIEGVLRFIAHSICELDYNTRIDPAGIGFDSNAGESFCRVTPEWAPLLLSQVPL